MCFCWSKSAIIFDGTWKEMNREQASALRSHLKSGARNSRRRRRPFPNPDATHGHAIHAIAELRSFAGATPGGLNRPHARGRNSSDAAHSKAPLQMADPQCCRTEVVNPRQF